jgi:hypothetical protein
MDGSIPWSLGSPTRNCDEKMKDDNTKKVQIAGSWPIGI